MGRGRDGVVQTGPAEMRALWLCLLLVACGSPATPPSAFHPECDKPPYCPPDFYSTPQPVQAQAVSNNTRRGWAGSAMSLRDHIQAQ